MSLYQSRIGSNQAGDFTTTDVAAFIKYTKQIKEHCVYLDLPVMTIEEALEEYSESSNSVINLNVSYNGSRQQHYLSQVHNSSQGILSIEDDVDFGIRYDQEDKNSHGYKGLLQKCGPFVKLLNIPMNEDAVDRDSTSVDSDHVVEHCQNMHHLSVMDS